MERTIYKSNSFNISKPLLDQNYHLSHDDKYNSANQTLRLTRWKIYYANQTIMVPLKKGLIIIKRFLMNMNMFQHPKQSDLQRL